MATYSDARQRDLDQRSGEAMNRRATAKELAEHYAWSGPQQSWFIAADEQPTHCENCGGDGGWHDYAGRWDPCPVCDGTGEAEVERVLIDLDDLEECFGC